jgi:hypothetical protein
MNVSSLFVDFLTGKEAQSAMTALSRTHLFGRHLVLEWASEDTDTIDGTEQGQTRRCRRRLWDNNQY